MCLFALPDYMDGSFEGGMDGSASLVFVRVVVWMKWDEMGWKGKKGWKGIEGMEWKRWKDGKGKEGSKCSTVYYENIALHCFTFLGLCVCLVASFVVVGDGRLVLYERGSECYSFFLETCVHACGLFRWSLLFTRF